MSEELTNYIRKGKEAITNSKYDDAISYFEKAIEIAKSVSSSLQGIIGISYAFMALAYGKKKSIKEARESIITASEYFPSEPKNPIAYASVLLGLGIEFQKLELFECSVFSLKNALSIVRNQSVEIDLETISIIARSLAFSYSKIMKNKDAAKLFRIAADLEDNPETAIELYRNSAYLYYKENVKEEAINNLETIFNKYQSLKNEKKQKEIAKFQGTIAYEIYLDFKIKSYFDLALAYLEISIAKFSFLKVSSMIITLLYEKSLILKNLGRNWQSYESLKSILEQTTTEEVEEYQIKSAILLLIHALEIENYAEANYYLNNISKDRMDYLNHSTPLLAEKILEIRNHLKIAAKRGQIQSDIRFTRRDLDLPVDQLIMSSEISKNIIQSQQEDLSNLKPPEMEVSIDTLPQNSKMKSPTIGALEDLFMPLSDSSIKEDEEKEQDFSRLFKEHQITEIEENNSIKTPQYEKVTEVEPLHPRVEELSQIQKNEITLSNIVKQLQKAGWSVRLNLTSSNRRGADPDIIAEKGLIRKKRKLIFLAEDPTDAEICSFLLQSNLEDGRKIVFLLTGNPKDVNVSLGIKLVTQINQLF